MKRAIIVLIIVCAMSTASPAFAHNRRKARKRHHAVYAVAAYNTPTDANWAQAQAIYDELTKTSTPDVTLFGVEFWAALLPNQETK